MFQQCIIKLRFNLSKQPVLSFNLLIKAAKYKIKEFLFHPLHATGFIPFMRIACCWVCRAPPHPTEVITRSKCALRYIDVNLPPLAHSFPTLHSTYGVEPFLRYDLPDRARLCPRTKYLYYHSQ